MPKLQNTGYTRSAVIAHWLMAGSIFFLFISSWWMLSLPLASKEYTYRTIPFQLHKNFGITVVFLMAMLLYVRLKYRPAPVTLSAMRPWMHNLATIDHIIIYIVILICCLSGYLSSAYSGWGTTLWWVLELPDWAKENEELNILFSDVHLWTCWVLLALISVHISGALFHAFRNDGVIRRMLHL